MKITLSLLLAFGLLAGCASNEEVDPEVDGPPIEDTTPIIDQTIAEPEPIEPISEPEPEPMVNQEPVQNTPVISETGASASGISDEDLTPQALLEEKDTPLATRVIYFEYNSAKVSSESLQLLQTHGDFISENGNVHVRLEGHADERGSREYNVALGDRRNQSVRRLLLFQGASTDQIETVSYGEELPAVVGHDEEFWSKNRRVELFYEVK